MRSTGLTEPVIAVAAALAILSWAGAASASPANGKAANAKICTELAAEQQSLIGLGVKRNMEKGADWARDNLPQGDLNMIQRFIDVSERIKFRCTPPEALVRLKAIDTGEDDGEDEENGPKDKDTADESAADGKDGESSAVKPKVPAKPSTAAAPKKPAAPPKKPTAAPEKPKPAAAPAKPQQPKQVQAKKAPQ